MGTNRETLPGFPLGEQPVVEKCAVAPIVADTFAGRIHVEWDGSATVTPLGQLPFFIEYLKQDGLFNSWVARLSDALHEPECIRANAAFSGRCFRRCWPVTGAVRKSRRRDATRSIRRCRA